MNVGTVSCSALQALWSNSSFSLAAATFVEIQDSSTVKYLDQNTACITLQFISKS